MRVGRGRISGREPVVAAILLAAAVAVSGCASGSAFRDQGASAARRGDWDAAVEYYRRALQEAPDRVEHRIALERAMLSAARHHAAAAAELEALGDLPGALRGYRRAYELDPSNEPAGVKIANLQQTLRERAEAARAPAPIEAMRTQARLDTQPPLLDPVSDEPLVIEFADTSLRDVLDFLGEAAGINVVYDRDFEDLTLSVALAGVTFEQALSRILAANGAFHKVVDPTDDRRRARDAGEARRVRRELVIRTFYVSHGDVEALVEMLTALVSVPDMPVAPQLVANVEAKRHHGAGDGAGRRHRRAGPRGERQAAGRGRHRRGDSRGQPRAREAVRPRPVALLHHDDVLAGGQAGRADRKRRRGGVRPVRGVQSGRARRRRRRRRLLPRGAPPR